jgi:phosphatidylglycerophosphate synthase
MYALLDFEIDWAAIEAVPTYGWILVGSYTLLIMAVYWFGIPNASADKRKAVGRKSVGHGLSLHTTNVTVYRAWWTEANVITGLGIVGMLLIMSITVTDVPMLNPLIPLLFVLAQAVSDGLDGLACKRWDCHTDLGAFLDALRDRMAILAAILCIIYDGSFTWWVAPGALVVMASELWICILGCMTLLRKRQLNSHGIGQARQLVHLGAIAFVITGMYLTTLSPNAVATLTALAALVMAPASAITAVHYHRAYAET